MTANSRSFQEVDEDGVLLPRSAFHFYFNAKIDLLKTKHPTIANIDAALILGDRFKDPNSTSARERNIYL